MNRVVKILLTALLWCGVVAYVIFGSHRAAVDRSEVMVRDISVSVDTIQNGRMITPAVIRGWLDRSAIRINNRNVDSVDLIAIERMVGGNGFVESVDAYVTMQGLLHVDVAQRSAVMRLVVNGYNKYVTEEGFLFDSPPLSSLYVPVVSGSYRPPVPLQYQGDAGEYVAAQIDRVKHKIEGLDSLRLVQFDRLIYISKSLDTVRKARPSKGFFESKESFQIKRSVWLPLWDRALDLRRYRNGLVDREFAKIDKMQNELEREQKKLQKNYKNFLKLITFVKLIEDNEFWRGEVVQIIADTTPSGVIQITLVPRSGDHKIIFGELESADQKFALLEQFYKCKMGGYGWGEFSTINVNYKGQIVCKR